MNAAKTILLSCLGRRKSTLAQFSIGFLALAASFVGAITFNVGQADARETCRFSQQISGYTQTEGDVAKSRYLGDQMCIGAAYGPTSAVNGSFFEFVVKFNGQVSNIKSITFKNDDGNAGGLGQNQLEGIFQKVGDQDGKTTFVVKPRDKAGYLIPYNFRSSPKCEASDKRTNITIDVDANNAKQTMKFNLCDSATYNRNYTIERVADLIPVDGQQGGVGGKGRITGEFKTTRWGAAAGAPEREGRASKRCVTKIVLAKEGGPTKEGDANADWYTLTDGNLEIPNLDAGKYNLTINYNDRLCMQQDHQGANPAWTSDNIVAEAKGIEVKAGQDTRISLTNPPPPGTGDSSQTPDQPVCTTGTGLAGALAWILCPAAALIASATEFIERNLIYPFLTVSPLTPDDKNPVYLLWQSIRNIANIVFIIAFFIVIFSQATSIGLNSYGIKRLLPRIFLVAIGTNLSYFFMAFLVDAFNVFGAGIGQLVMQALQQTKIGGENYDPSGFQFFTLGATALIAILVKAGPVLGWLFGLIGMAFLIILVAVIVLVIRHMLLIGIAVISPFAFVALLFPNTEQKGIKIFSTFGKLLAMYPFIILLFGTGKIFSAVLGNPNYNFTGDASSNAEGFAEAVRVIFQFFANALPLLGLPLALVVGGSIMRTVTNTARRMASRAGSRVASGVRDSRLGGFAREKLDERRTRRRGTPPPTSGPAAYMPWNLKRRAGQAIRGSNAFNRATGGFGTYLDRENASARREMNEKASKFLGGDLSAAFALEKSMRDSSGNIQSKRDQADTLRSMVATGKYKNDIGDDVFLNQATTQRLSQFLNADNYRGAAAASAVAHTLADTNQINKGNYRTLAMMAGDEGTIARDEFVAEQNVYNDQKGFSNLAQAAFDNKGNFVQYAGKDYGLKDVNGVYKGLRLGDTKKQVFADEELSKVFTSVGNRARTNNKAYTDDSEYRTFVREAARMKPDQLDAFVKSMGYDNQADRKRFQSHIDQMRKEAKS